jgi:hypothetical protein
MRIVRLTLNLGGLSMSKTRKERIDERASEYMAENPRLTLTQARSLARHVISDSEQIDRDEQAEFDAFVREAELDLNRE